MLENLEDVQLQNAFQNSRKNDNPPYSFL